MKDILAAWWGKPSLTKCLDLANGQHARALQLDSQHLAGHRLVAHDGGDAGLKAPWICLAQSSRVSGWGPGSTSHRWH